MFFSDKSDIGANNTFVKHIHFESQSKTSL